MTLIEEKTLADHDINVRSIRQELRLLEEQLKKHGRNEPQSSPTVTDEDTVSRQAVYDTLTEYYHHDTDIQHKALAEAISRVPPSPSRPSGHWIKAKDLSGEYYYCSNCKEELPRVATESATWDNPYPTEYSIDTTDFCPHCGADMRQQEGGAV